MMVCLVKFNLLLTIYVCFVSFQMFLFIEFRIHHLNLSGSKGSSWSWLYGSWIYNFPCNQCLSIITKVVSANSSHGKMYSIQHYVIKFVWFQSSYSEKKPTVNSRYTVNKIVIFIKIFLGIPDFLTSSLYRSKPACWGKKISTYCT
jgi:hypothetical protein